MYEESLNFWDIVISLAVVAVAAIYVYRKLFKKKSACGGGGCSSCPSSVSNKK